MCCLVALYQHFERLPQSVRCFTGNQVDVIVSNLVNLASIESLQWLKLVSDNCSASAHSACVYYPAPLK